MKRPLLLLALVCAIFFLSVVSHAASPSDFFTEQDAQHITSLIIAKQQADGSFKNIATAHYSVSSLSLLKHEVPHKEHVCAEANNFINEKKGVDKIHHALNTLKLAGCNVPSVNKAIVDKLFKTAQTGTLRDVYFALSSLAILKPSNVAEIEDADVTGIAKSIAELQENDGYFLGSSSDSEGSALNAGYALHSLAILKTLVTLSEEDEEQVRAVASKVSFLLDKAAEAEEENDVPSFTDPNPLNNLRATSLVWTGINALAETGETIEVSEVCLSHL